MRVRRPTRQAAAVLAIAVATAACGLGSDDAASDDADGDGADASEDGDSTGDDADGGDADGDDAAAEEITGEITFSTLQLQPTFTDYINGVIDDFESMHEGVSVEWVDVPFEGAAERVITDASAGQLADVINLNPDFALEIARTGAFVNMDDAAGDVRGDYIEGAWDAFAYPFLDHGVALPWYLSTELTMYNAADYEAAGLDPEAPPGTFEEMFEDARTIASETERFGLHPALENRFVIDLAKQGIPILNDDGTAAAFDTDEAVAYLSELVALFDEGVMPPDSPTETHRDEINAYQAGQLALFPSGPNFLGIIEENAPDIAETTMVGPQVTGSSGATNMAVMGVMVPQSSENQATALAFAKFLTNAENQTEFAKIVTILPSVTAALEDPYFTDVEGDDATAEARRLSAEQIVEAQVLRPTIFSDEANQAVVDKAEAALLGQLEPAEAIEQAAAEVTEILERSAG